MSYALVNPANLLGLVSDAFATESKSSFAARLRNAYRRHRSYVNTVRELEQLSDCELAELGLFFSDIPRVARDDVARRFGS